MYNYGDSGRNMYNYNNFESIKTIVNFNEVVDRDNWNHFHYICNLNYSNLEVIKYCVEKGAYLNFKDNYGSTPFHYICNENPTKEVLEYCLENGAYLNIKNNFGSTQFYYICKYNKDLIKYCKPYMNEYDYIKTLKEHNLNWKEYV